MQSSYIVNNYGEIFTSIITAYKPMVCIELGVLDGYSTVAIAKGLKKNGQGHLYAYDLFEDYPFNRGNREEAMNNLKEAGVDSFVTLKKADAMGVHPEYDSVHFLHVDISNTGDIIRKIIELWNDKLSYGSLVLFEGGSEERDKESWMIKYKKKSIKTELENNPIIRKNYVFGTYLKWPSLTVLLKKT